jgi:3,4-dihydroxyphenylacetate 2,3-dioxygenase
MSSTALSHDLVRGPSQWPTDERQAMDLRFIELTCAGDIAALKNWLPEFSRAGVVEMGGRVAATFLGSLDALGDVPLSGRQYGAYGQSSGSGNVSLAVTPAN